MDRILITVTEAARLLSVSRPTIYKWSRVAGFPAVKIGGCTRIVASDLIEWAKAQERGADLWQVKNVPA